MSSVTEEIKSRLDIVTYINQSVPLKKAGRYYKACCPFHAENTPSFVVNQDTQTWRCFGSCAEGGDIFSFAMKQQGWTFVEALEELGKQAGVQVEKQSPIDREKTQRLDKLRGIMDTAAKIYHAHLMNKESDAAAKVRQYVGQKRGLQQKTVEDFQIGYAPDGWQTLHTELTDLGYDEADLIEVGLVRKNEETGRVYDYFRNRLMIPIRDDRGRVIGFGARALAAEDNPKYLNSPQTPIFDKSATLFGLDMAKDAIRETETAVIVEGYLDVIQAHQANYKNVVAQMGTALTEQQLKRIAPRYAKRIIMALDSDAAGQNATRRSLEVARKTLEADFAGRLSVDIRVLHIPDAKDPDDLIRENPKEWEGLINRAAPVADFVIRMETEALEPDSPITEREAVARRVLPILVASESDLYKQENIQKLAIRLRINERDLLMWASDKSRPSKPAPPKTQMSVEEPPPLDYDLLEPPPDYDEDYSLPPQTINQPENELERYCLRTLLKEPDTFFQVNRRFREFANGDHKLLNGPLSDLGIADFTHSDYRSLMRVFIVAVDQHEVDTLDYLYENLDATLQPQFDQLMKDDRHEIYQHIQNRYSNDFNLIWKQYKRFTKTAREQLFQYALQLRRKRLKQEMDELGFIQEEAQRAGDMMKSREFSSQLMLYTQAKKKLDMALDHKQQRHSQLT